MASEPAGDFNSYVLRHERDSYAHAPMRHDLRNEFVATQIQFDSRITALERWQQRIIGGMMFSSFLIGGGAVGFIIEIILRTSGGK